MKTLLVDAQSIEKFVDLIARAKAIWTNPELLNLTVMASSPSEAYDLVLQKTGKRKKALAARWYAILLRDYEPIMVRAALRRIQDPNGLDIDGFKKHLTTTLLNEE
jgi:hypothetical protein